MNNDRGEPEEVGGTAEGCSAVRNRPRRTEYQAGKKRHPCEHPLDDREIVSAFFNVNYHVVSFSPWIDW